MDRTGVSDALSAWWAGSVLNLSLTAVEPAGKRRAHGRIGQRLCKVFAILGLWLLASCPAHAVLVTVTPVVSFSDSVSVTDDEAASSTSNDGADLGSSLLQQFDAALGVLTGATINLVSTRNQSLTVSSTAGTRGGGPAGAPPAAPPGGGPGGNNVTSSGSGSSTVNISAPGVDYTFSTAIETSGDCTNKSWKACSNTTLAAGLATNQDIAANASLDSYVGTGTVTVSRTAPTLSASQENDVFDGTESTQYDLTWAGDLSITYSYLLHAAPSFDSSAPNDTLVLDFGTVTQGSAVSPLGFSLFNLADSERVALDLDSFSLTGGSDTGALDTGLAIFSALAQGDEQPFLASFDTTNAGSFLETYTLIFSDADVGAATSRFSYSLTLTLQGEVIPLPVPDAVWLFGSGLIGLVGIARHSPDC